MDATVAQNEEHQRRQRICQEAFVDERFVIFVNFYSRLSAACFIPKYDEAPLFLRRYLAPFMLDAGGALARGSWLSALPIEVESAAKPVYWRQFIRWRDVASVEVWTETDEQRQRLDEALPEAINDYLAEVRARRGEMGLGG